MSGQQPAGVLRLHGRTLATPADWWRHAGTGRTLILVLNLHMGPAPYFAAMGRRLAERHAAGWAVQVEGIRAAPEQDWAGASAAELAARQIMLDRYRDRPAAVAARLGWVFQGDKRHGLRRAGGWASADLTDRQVLQFIGPDAILAMGAAIAAAEARLGRWRDLFDQAAGPLVLRALARPHDQLSQAISRFAPDVYAVLLEHRSKLAAAAADPARDHVLVWGAEHAASIGEALAAAGWEPARKRRWLTVGQLPPYVVSVTQLAPAAAHVSLVTWRGLWSGEIDAEQAWAERKARRVAGRGGKSDHEG